MTETINLEENLLETLKKIKNTDVEEFSLKNKTFQFQQAPDYLVRPHQQTNNRF